MIWRDESDLSRFICISALKEFAVHWSFYIFVLCALAGWSIGATCKAVSQKPSWLFAD